MRTLRRLALPGLAVLALCPALVHAQAITNDAAYKKGQLWGMYGDTTRPVSVFGSQAAEAWANGHADCGTVYVGILGDGLMLSHPDLAANIGSIPGEVANGVDDDGNGYVDDVHGWDFHNGDATLEDAGIEQDSGGTQVAGIVGGVGNNRIGVAGVCWHVQLIAAKVVSVYGPAMRAAAVADGLDYMTDLKQRGLNLVATVNTWGSYDPGRDGFSQDIQDAISRANTAGVLFITDAGHNAVDLDGPSAMPWHGYPARYAGDNVIAVVPLDASGAVDPFANTGGTSVDVGAPGTGIFSTIAKTNARGRVSPGYAYFNFGAAGFVAGAAALYKAYHPAATAAQVKAAILSAGVPTTSLQGKTATGDRLNIGGF